MSTDGRMETEPLHEEVDTPIDEFRLDDARSGTPLRGRDATLSLHVRLVSASIRTGTTSVPMCQPVSRRYIRRTANKGTLANG